MGTGAFRDASAAMERVAALGEENERLKAENAELRAQIEQLTAARDGSNEAIAMRKLLKEKNALKDQLEESRIANIAAITRMKDEAKAQAQRQATTPEFVLANTIKRLEAQRDSLKDQLSETRSQISAENQATIGKANAEIQRLTEAHALLEKELRAHAEKSARNDNAVTVLKRVTEERNLLAKKLQTESEHEDNGAAVLKRVMEERDDLARENRELREQNKQATRTKPSSLLGRLFR